MTLQNSSKRFLYLDTTDFLILGILDEKFDWVEYLEFPDKKSASQIHPLLNDLTNRHQISPLSFEGVFVCSGPGSYTGIRLSENFAQVFEWQNKKVYSFFHHEIPYLLGVKKGSWACSAFKGEAFVYSWNEAQNESALVATANIADKVAGYYGHTGAHSTRQLIFDNSHKFFDLIFKRNIRLSPYYFRTLENEFKAQGT